MKNTLTKNIYRGMICCLIFVFIATAIESLFNTNNLSTSDCILLSAFMLTISAVATEHLIKKIKELF